MAQQRTYIAQVYLHEVPCLVWYLGPNNCNVPDFFYFGQLIGVPLDISWWTANDMIVDGSTS